VTVRANLDRQPVRALAHQRAEVHGRQGTVVGRRNRLLRYLKTNQEETYKTLINELSLRK